VKYLDTAKSVYANECRQARHIHNVITKFSGRVLGSDRKGTATKAIEAPRVDKTRNPREKKASGNMHSHTGKEGEGRVEESRERERGDKGGKRGITPKKHKARMSGAEQGGCPGGHC